MAVSSLYRVRLEAYHMGSKPLEFEGTNGFVVTLEWSVWDLLSVMRQAGIVFSLQCPEAEV